MEENRTAGDLFCELSGRSIDYDVWSYGVSVGKGLMSLGLGMGCFWFAIWWYKIGRRKVRWDGLEVVVLVHFILLAQFG